MSASHKANPNIWQSHWTKDMWSKCFNNLVDWGETGVNVNFKVKGLGKGLKA